MATESAREERLLNGPNPFEPAILPFGRSLDVPDIASINREASDAVLALVEATRRDGVSRSILLRGESGTGKTHLIRRVAHQLGHHALFASIDPIGDPTHLMRHILRRLVTDLAALGGPFGSMLRELAGAMIAEGLYMLPKGYERTELLDAILEAPPGFMQAEPRLAARCIELFSAALTEADDRIQPDAARVLLRVWLHDAGATARDWLKGLDLDHEELAELGVERSLADEDDAALVLHTLSAMARLFRPLVLCFDQTETLASLGGEAVVRALLQAIARLRALPGLVCVFTCLDDVWIHRYQAIAEAVTPPPLTEPPAVLTRLGPEEARSIVAARLAPLTSDLQPPYATWPVPGGTLAAMADLSPREVLEYCGRNLDQMRREGVIREISPPAGPPEADNSDMALDRAWTAAQDVGADFEPDEQTTIDGLHCLARVARAERPSAWPIVLQHQREIKTASLLVTVASAEGEPCQIRFVASDTQNGTSLSRLLDKLLIRIDEDQVKCVLLRLAEERPTWRVANKRLFDLHKLGGRVVRPQGQALRDIVAVKRLIGRVAAGDVTSGGSAVTEEQATAYLAGKPELGDILIGMLNA